MAVVADGWSNATASATAERGTAQAHRFTRTDDVVIALTSWRSGIIDHLPLADPNLVALLAEDEPTERGTRRAQDRDDAIIVGEARTACPVAPAQPAYRPGHHPSMFGDRRVVEQRQPPNGGPLGRYTALAWQAA